MRDVRRCYECGRNIAWGGEVFLTDERGARHFRAGERVPPVPTGEPVEVERVATCRVLIRGDVHREMEALA